MQKQSGNFLLQALLALTLVFAFMPFLANKLSTRDTQARLYAVSHQMQTAHTAARIFLRDDFRANWPSGNEAILKKNPSNCITGNTNDCKFSELEDYGLPMGFNPHTAFNQDITLHAQNIIENGDTTTTGYLAITKGDMENMEWKTLVRMLGLYASVVGDEIHMEIPLDESVSDMVLRSGNPGRSFDNDLNMGNNNIDGMNILTASRGSAGEVEVRNNLVVDTSVQGGLTITDQGTLYGDTARFYPNSNGDSLQLIIANNIKPKVNIKRTATFDNMFLTTGSTATLTVDMAAFVDNLYMTDSCDNSKTFTAQGANTVGKIKDHLFAPNAEITANIPDLSHIVGMYHEENSKPTYNDVLNIGENDGIYIDNSFHVDRLIVGKESMTQYEHAQTNNPSAHPDRFTVFIDTYGYDSYPSVLPDINISSNLNNGHSNFDILDSDEVTRNANITIDIEGGTVNGDSCESFLGGGININKSVAANLACQYLVWHRLERRLNYKLYNKCRKINQSNPGNCTPPSGFSCTPTTN